MFKFLNQFKTWVLDLIFPRECLGCGTENDWICSDCSDKIEFRQEQDCYSCRKPSITGQVCKDCKTQTSLDKVWIAADYDQETVQQSIHWLKYKYVEELGERLAEILARFVKQHKLIELSALDASRTIITAVPLNKKRYLQRSFNQSGLIAQNLAEHLELEYFPQIIRRIRNAPPQAQLNREERLVNVKDAFDMPEDYDLSGRTIIIVDDVLTTGSTLDECARVFKRNNADKVIGLVLARN